LSAAVYDASALTVVLLADQRLTGRRRLQAWIESAAESYISI
jgi:hypothetical protein